MGRALIIINGNADRAKAGAWVSKAPLGTRVEFKASKRSLPQNDKLWAMLTEISEQATWAGKRRTTEEWKDLFTAAVKTAGGGVEAVPGLTGGLMLLGLRTSDMSVGEMADLITFIDAWGAENGVLFSGDEATERRPQSGSAEVHDPISSTGRDGGQVKSRPPVARREVAA